MPYKDHEKKLEAMRRWREDKMGKGYGKWLYERRKLRFEDADRFRSVIEHALDNLRAITPKTDAKDRERLVQVTIEELEQALRESDEAEKKLGMFKEEE